MLAFAQKAKIVKYTILKISSLASWWSSLHTNIPQ